MSSDPDAGGATPPSDQSDRTRTTLDARTASTLDPRTDPEADDARSVSAVAERGRRRIDHACASIDVVLDHLADEADHAALCRARSAVVNATGDLDELEAMVPPEGG